MAALALSVGLSRWVIDGMLPVSLVLTCLRLYGSPAVAGVTVFLATFPGLLLTPFAGALLDRRGRIAFIRLDIIVAIVVFTALAGLVATARLGVPLIFAAAVVLSCTRPLAQAGARAQVPSMAPERLWDRLNAVDTAIFTAVALTAPAAAAALFGLVGASGLFGGGAALLAVSGVALTGVPATGVAAFSASLWAETRAGVAYFLRNRTLIALAVSSSLLNVAPGTLIVVLPIMVVNHLHRSTAVLGLVFVVEQVGAAAALLVVGRLGTRDRERGVMSGAALLTVAGMLLVLVAGSVPLIGAGVLLVGIGNGPYWVAVYGLRQRRTAAHMFARAFALSYACNMAGMPLGSALAGALSGGGAVTTALAVASVCPLLAIVALRVIPTALPALSA